LAWAKAYPRWIVGSWALIAQAEIRKPACTAATTVPIAQILNMLKELGGRPLHELEEDAFSDIEYLTLLEATALLGFQPMVRVNFTPPIGACYRYEGADDKWRVRLRKLTQAKNVGRNVLDFIPVENQVGHASSTPMRGTQKCRQRRFRCRFHASN